MNKKELIVKRLLNTYCRIQPSSIHGVGVFAFRDIPAYTAIFYGAGTSGGIIVTRDEIKTLPRPVQRFLYDFLVSDEHGAIEVPPNGITGLDMSFYLNHSDNPNLETHDEGETFFTNREIGKGEELTVDYKTFDPYSADFSAKT